MNRPWGVNTVAQIFAGANVRAGLPDGRWVVAVCEPYDSLRSRIQAAWWVLTGRAHAVIWPKAGELETALGMLPSQCKRPPFGSGRLEGHPNPSSVDNSHEFGRAPGGPAT